MEGAMTGLRMKFTRGVLVLLSGSMAISQAPAHELGDFGHYIPGLTMGVPVAAVPEPGLPGLYFFNTTIYYPGFAGTGQRGGPGCLRNKSASLSRTSAGVMLPCGVAAG